MILIPLHCIPLFKFREFYILHLNVHMYFWNVELAYKEWFQSSSTSLEHPKNDVWHYSQLKIALIVTKSRSYTIK